MAWLAETPRAIVRAHLRMLPRLEAEESLLTSQRIGVGNRLLRRGDGPRELIREWARLARADRAPERLMPARGGAMGIGYRKVRRR